MAKKKEYRMIKLISPEANSHLVVRKIGRNTPCPCGSGKKVKYCCETTAKYYSVPNTKGFNK
jgi:uncharacterized protein YecA (UPF0149 family)